MTNRQLQRKKRAAATVGLIAGLVIGFTSGVICGKMPENKPLNIPCDEIIKEAEKDAKTGDYAEIMDIEQPADPEPVLVSLGKYKITAYCACIQCCGKTDGITATGTKATAGRTIAVDPKVIPYGSTVIIDGNEYIAEDCGGAIKQNRIDIYFDTHEEALIYGVQYHEVFIEERTF